MKKTLLTLLFTFSIFTFYSQGFAPTGAEWYYQEGHAFSNDIDYIKFTSRKDTLIMGKVCQKITKRHSVSCNFRKKPEYLFSRNDTVFFFDLAFNKFQVLYDFSAKKKDSWTIKVKHGNEVTSLLITVDSVYLSQINGQNLRTLDVTYNHKGNIGNVRNYSSTIIEKIGDVKYMFNWQGTPDMVCDMNYSQGLRCYQDTNVGMYSTGIADSCNHIYSGTGIESIEPFTEIRIYPNPAHDYLEITGLGYSNYSVKLFDLQGKLLKLARTSSNMKLDISQINQGVYMILLQNEDKVIGYKKLIKQ